MKAVSGFYYVKSAEDVYECRAKGRFRHVRNTPLAGDKVTIAITEPGKGILTEIHSRKNVFTRPPVANIDKIVIVASETIPVTDPFLIDRMTVTAINNNCSPVICINKLDIAQTDNLYDIYKMTGFSVVKTSALTGDGIDELISLITGSICAFCGNSGVGKSSILNAILPGACVITGDVSRKLGRGRHTTRHTQLFDLPCGAVAADTPGFSVFDTGLSNEPGQLQYLFPDIIPHIGNCRFDDCVHITEPGCSVLEAVNNGIIHKSRHSSYVKLYKQAQSSYQPYEKTKNSVTKYER